MDTALEDLVYRKLCVFLTKYLNFFQNRSVAQTKQKIWGLLQLNLILTVTIMRRCCRLSYRSSQSQLRCLLLDPKSWPTSLPFLITAFSYLRNESEGRISLICPSPYKQHDYSNNWIFQYSVLLKQIANKE